MMGRNVWYLRLGRHNDAAARLFMIASDRYPDGAIITCSAALDARILSGLLCEVVLDDDGRARRATPVTSLGAPQGLWFAEVRESSARPPAVCLMAFAGSGVPAGTILDEHDALETGVSADDQLAAVRWYPSTGEVDQIYVQPDLRRKRIGTALVLTAGAVAVAQGWPRLWSDGQRTELGEVFCRTSLWSHRVGTLEHVLAPMTPA